MYLQSIAHAVPEHSFSQAECWELVQKSGALETLSSRSGTLVEKILCGDCGIASRHFATGEPERLFGYSASDLNQMYEKAAPDLSGRALARALERGGVSVAEIDALWVCTCTGYLCPGVSSYVAEQLGLGEQCFLQDLVGLGCGAAIPMWRAADGFLAANPGATVACVAVEVCSAAFYMVNDPGVLISACLFGDGASASIWRGRGEAGGYRIGKFNTVHLPRMRERLRFMNAGGKLCNRLDRSVPALAAEAVGRLYKEDGGSEAGAVASHTGGRDVLDALEKVMPGVDLSLSRRVLRCYGNQSSPSVAIVLEELLGQPGAPERIWLSSFGAGFSAHSCWLEREVDAG